MTYENALTVLAGQIRRQIFERLRGSPLADKAIAAGPPVSRPAVSQQLKALKQAGLVPSRSERHAPHLSGAAGRPRRSARMPRHLLGDALEASAEKCERRACHVDPHRAQRAAGARERAQAAVASHAGTASKRARSRKLRCTGIRRSPHKGWRLPSSVGRNSATVGWMWTARSITE